MKRAPSFYKPAPLYKRCPICHKFIITRRNPMDVNPYDAGTPRDVCKCFRYNVQS